MASGHDEMKRLVRGVLESFIDRLEDKRTTGTQLLDLLPPGSDPLTSADIGSKPEQFVEEELIRPLLEAVGLSVTGEVRADSGDTQQWPDFGVDDLGVGVVGEDKALNKVEEACSQVKGYLDKKSVGAEYGIATDGAEWYVFKIELGGDFTEYPEVGHVDLRPALLAIARQKGYVSQQTLAGDETADEDAISTAVSAFVTGVEDGDSAFEGFARERFQRYLTQTAPRALRDRRKRDVEEFYELYIELLFGESDEYDYDNCLLNDIRPPAGASEDDERLFAITLVNRLLFVKFLETREVLPDGFLLQRVREYERWDEEDRVTGSLYEAVIRPLFTELLDTPPEARDPRFRGGDETDWWSDVPFLNGGLFRPNVEREGDYRVNNRTLPQIVRQLIEESELDLAGEGFDPAILGSVFEKTINHIEQERTQKDIGAYYTPNDVTEIVTEQAVDPKIKETIIEATVAERPDRDEQAIREQLGGQSLSAILRDVEQGDEWFSNTRPAERAYEKLSELKVIDPACGSGHFLTTAMDEIHRAQVSLLTAQNFGQDPAAEERFEAKRELALNAIYGVDIDAIGVEIAKLRVWLKIVEGNSWEPSFGKLPNIDVNIKPGNSLIGLPMTGTYDDTDVWTDDIGEIESRRVEYKQDDTGDPRQLEEFLEREVRPTLDDTYLGMFGQPVETAIEEPASDDTGRPQGPTAVEQWDALTPTIDPSRGESLSDVIDMVRVKREDGQGFAQESDAEQSQAVAGAVAGSDGQSEVEALEELDFRVYTKSAKLDLSDRESKLKKLEGQREISSAFETLVAELRALLAGPYYFSEVQRTPTQYDLDRVQGTPFHWVAEFPEVAEKGENGRHSINFDLVLGNPPYGDLLSDDEKIFVSTFETEGINDISAQFVERQLQLLEDGGYFGNITTMRLVYQSSLQSLHDTIQSKLSSTKIACFGSRPSRVFQNADIKTAIFSGGPAIERESDQTGTIETSDAVIFTDDNRQDKFENIDYREVDDLILRDRIGGGSGGKRILPKIGPDVKNGILEKLRERQKPLFHDRYAREEDDTHQYPVWRREGVRYWINPMLEELYSAREVKPMFFESETEQNAAFLILNSSLFYVYWLTYGNFHHLNWTQIKAFPFPSQEELEKHEGEINSLADRLWTRMEQQFDPDLGVSGEFHMRPVKPVVDEVDDLLGEIYDLTDEELEFVKAYLTDCGDEYGRVGPQNQTQKEATAGDD
jgi:predicted type IV restriction endonuclease